MPAKKQTRAQLGDVAQLFHDKLGQSNLDNPEYVKTLRLKPYTLETAPAGLPYAAAGFTIPYFDLHGKPTQFWRYRYLDNPPQKGFAALTEQKWLRYAQPPKTVNEVYMPPIVPWHRVAAMPDQPVMFTEGELKAACGCAYGDIPTLGLGGVWCFKSGNNHMPMLPVFKDFNWKGRKVYIAYDSDAVTNPKVMQAENAFARELTQLGAVPHIVRIPPGAQGAKCGLDDYIVAGKSLKTLINKAVEWRQAQELFRLNEEVVYVRDPGLILRLDNLQRMAPAAFKEHAYSTRIYYQEVATEKGTKLEEKSAPKEWLKWPQRAEVSNIVYEPGQDRVHQGSLNIWPGWAVQPKKGDIGPWKELLDYLFARDKSARQWFERWCAYPLQHPGTKMFSSSVLWGLTHGTGKSLIGYSLFRIYGKNSTEIKDHNLQESHNEWAENKQFIMGDEITGGDKRGMGDRLKGLITQEQLRINVKYIPSYTLKDCINYYFTSNHPDSFFLEDRDRRYFIWEVVGDPLSLAFYKRYEKWLKHSGDVGPAALFHHLLHLDLGDFSPTAPAPMTDSKEDMLATGRSDIGTWCATLKESPDTILRMDNAIIPFCLWRSEDLLRLYDPEGRGKVTANGLSRELRRQGFARAANGHGVVTRQDGQCRLWVCRPVHSSVLNGNAAAAGQYDDERQLGRPAKKKEKWK